MEDEVFVEDWSQCYWSRMEETMPAHQGVKVFPAFGQAELGSGAVWSDPAPFGQPGVGWRVPVWDKGQELVVHSRSS